MPTSNLKVQTYEIRSRADSQRTFRQAVIFGSSHAPRMTLPRGLLCPIHRKQLKTVGLMPGVQTGAALGQAIANR